MVIDEEKKSVILTFIENEINLNNSVTYKSLSRKFQIHNTLAKTLLKEFLVGKDSSLYLIIYAITGEKDGQLFVSLIENDLSDVKKHCVVLDEHIYCIQLAKTEFSPLSVYNIDKASYAFQNLSLSSIKPYKSVVRKCDSRLKDNIKEIKNDDLSRKAVTNNITKAILNDGKDGTEKHPADTIHEEVKNKVNKVSENDPLSGKLLNGKSLKTTAAKGGITSFFQKNNAENKSPKPSIQTDTDNLRNEEDIQSEIKVSKTISPSVATTESQNKRKSEGKMIPSKKKPKLKKKPEKKKEKPKMKRIIIQSDSSSSETIDDDSESESEKILDEELPVPEPQPEEKPAAAVIVVSGRKRKRVVIEKTSQDDEGFFHTEKTVEYQSYSSDDEDEAPDDTSKRQKTDNNVKLVEKQPINNVKNGNKNKKVVNSKSKQCSITSFFKRS